MYGNANGAAVIGDRAGNGLTNPPGRVGRKLMTASMIEFFRRLHKTHISFLNQVQEAHGPFGVSFGDRDNQTEIRENESVFPLVHTSDPASIEAAGANTCTLRNRIDSVRTGFYFRTKRAGFRAADADGDCIGSHQVGPEMFCVDMTAIMVHHLGEVSHTFRTHVLFVDVGSVFKSPYGQSLELRPSVKAGVFSEFTIGNQAVWKKFVFLQALDEIATEAIQPFAFVHSFQHKTLTIHKEVGELSFSFSIQ